MQLMRKVLADKVFCRSGKSRSHRSRSPFRDRERLIEGILTISLVLLRLVIVVIFIVLIVWLARCVGLHCDWRYSSRGSAALSLALLILIVRGDSTLAYKARATPFSIAQRALVRSVDTEEVLGAYVMQSDWATPFVTSLSLEDVSMWEDQMYAANTYHCEELFAGIAEFDFFSRFICLVFTIKIVVRLDKPIPQLHQSPRAKAIVSFPALFEPAFFDQGFQHLLCLYQRQSLSRAALSCPVL